VRLLLPRGGPERRERMFIELMTSDRKLKASRERIFIELMTSDRKLKASRQVSK